MAVIDVVSWSPQGNNTIYAWKFPESNLSTLTQLIVNESQEAILYSKGQIVGKFGPGKHTLTTENLPLLRNLFGIPFGKKNPFTAEVWFVNKVQPCNLNWYADRIIVHDPNYQTQLPLLAAGQYGLKIDNAEKFLVNLVGTKNQFDKDDMTEQFAGEFQTKVKSVISNYINGNKIGFKEISSYLDNISNYLADQLQSFWQSFGVKLTRFYVSSVDIDDTTEDGQKIKNAIAQQAAMSITGHTWQQEQMFDTANNTLGNLGAGGGGMLGGILAMNMMGGLGGGGMSGMMNPQYNNPTFAPGGSSNSGGPQMSNNNVAVKTVYCSNCGKAYLNSQKFCPNCGDPYNPCPKCGTDNDTKAKRCVSCGVPLTHASVGSNMCPGCNSPVTPGSAFCPNCGKKLSTSDQCSRCGTHLPPSVKFCPNCGNKR